MTALMLFGLACAALLGAPLFAVLAGVALVAFSGTETQLVVLADEHYKLAGSPHLITIPLFTLAGFVMAEGGAGERMVRVARAWLGWIPGGLAFVVVASCAFFTAFTGASGVTIVALGGLLVPMLRKEGYSERFALGLVTGSGSIGLLFPPSLPIILYGIVAAVDYEALYRVGFAPGILLSALLCAYGAYVGIRGGVRRIPFDMGEALASTRAGLWELAVPVVVAGAIYGGVTTVAEASGMCAAYVIFVERFVYRTITLRSVDQRPHLAKITREAMAMVGAILLILGVALGLTNYLVQEQVPMLLLEWVQQHVHSRTAFLVALTFFLLAVGCVMDIFSAIVVVVPLIIPVALQYGVHPLHLGVIFLANLEIGYLTPPVGLNLFISSLTFNRPVVALYRMALPFLLLLLAGLVCITFGEGWVMSAAP